jgi:hypothetical protein
MVHAESSYELDINNQYAQGFNRADITVVDTTILDEEQDLDPDNYDTVQAFETVEATIQFQDEEGTLSLIVAQNSDDEWQIWAPVYPQ